MMPNCPCGGVICLKLCVRGSKDARKLLFISPNQIRPSWSIAGRIMPLSVCGRGYSRKFPIAEVAGNGVACAWTGYVFVVLLFVDDVVVSLHDAVKSMRKIKNGSNSNRFIIIFLKYHHLAF